MTDHEEMESLAAQVETLSVQHVPAEEMVAEVSPPLHEEVVLLRDVTRRFALHLQEHITDLPRALLQAVQKRFSKVYELIRHMPITDPTHEPVRKALSDYARYMSYLLGKLADEGRARLSASERYGLHALRVSWHRMASDDLLRASRLQWDHEAFRAFRASRATAVPAREGRDPDRDRDRGRSRSVGPARAYRPVGSPHSLLSVREAMMRADADHRDREVEKQPPGSSGGRLLRVLVRRHLRRMSRATSPFWRNPLQPTH